MIESTWAEARDLVRRLEGTTVQRFAVKAGEYEIEIERGGEVAGRGRAGRRGRGRAEPDQRVFAGARRGDLRCPTRGPTTASRCSRRSWAPSTPPPQPGAKPFAEVGDVVEAGQTVCIVEAMKLMNEVAAAEGGKVVEICVENGDAGRVRAGPHVPRAGRGLSRRCSRRS